jgi:hypothetical protein
MKRATALAAAMTAAVTAALPAGCGRPTGPFAAGSGAYPLACMTHQRYAPGGRAAGDTAHGLEVLRYYTANGARPYCDGENPTAQDRDWARLYVRLGARPEYVRGILARP